MNKEKVKEILGIDIDTLDSYDINILVRKLRRDTTLKIVSKYDLIRFLEQVEMEKLNMEEKANTLEELERKEMLEDLERAEREFAGSMFDEFGNIITESENIENRRGIR